MSDAGDPPLRRLMDAIARGGEEEALAMLDASPGLAKAALAGGATRAAATDNFLQDIRHYVYAGDTALHVAAAAHRPRLARRLLALSADPAATNRRGATALHYCADGSPNNPAWNADLQAETVAALIAGGADSDAADRGGVTPLHRAVRCRCAAAVGALLEGGADAARANGNGSTPANLVAHPAGRSGSGSAEAKVQQAEIVRLLGRHGAA